MKFNYEDDETVGFLEINLSDKDLTTLLDEGSCESVSSFYHRDLCKKKVLITINKEFEDATR